MANGICNVLFLSTRDSARCMIAEAILNHWGRGKFNAFSVEIEPAEGADRPALEFLKAINLPTAGLRCRSWREFMTPASPAMDFVICLDDPSREIVEPSSRDTIIARWRISDPLPASTDDAMRKSALRRTFRELENRIKLFVLLRHDVLERKTSVSQQSRL